MATVRAPVRRRLLVAVCAALLLTACGGGDGGGNGNGSASCDLVSQNTWLRSYMRDWYFWSGVAPDPDPAPYTSVPDYFKALLFPGDGTVPADRWSYISDTASYSLFFSEGKTLGYGVFVNGVELVLPLRLRYVEPASPAAAQGLMRGDQIVSINGRSAADLVAAKDNFAMLTPAKAGDVLTLVIDRGAGPVAVDVTAAVYTLTPVSTSRVLTLADGRKAGYLVFKDFIIQGEAQLDAAFTAFRDAGVTELILDLRYNGGGRISTAAHFASLVAGAAHPGALFTTLRYNARHQSSNANYNLGRVLNPAPTFTHAVVISGRRTCSASELLVNGLKPYLSVVTIGEASCGKPFGFNPIDSCASTFSAVNFEAVNSLGAGRYYNGLPVDCAAPDEFTGVLGDPAERLTGSALTYLSTGACPPAAATDRQAAAARRARATGTEPGDRQGMIAD